ncbi:DUF998 domain-containing protein [Saccharibacillus sacchari]|uniref:DUF998 domain-containing protein n=1 Tax=Saccharibacillus sacchari TaxID=456493 RepID=A0ACC6PL23_9BACL
MRLPHRLRLGAGLFLSASVVYLAAETIAASAWTEPAYRYAFNNISDLGVRIDTVVGGRPIHSPLHLVMNIGFALQGILFLLAYALVVPLLSKKRQRPGIVLAAAHGIGMLLVAIFHGVNYEALDPHVIGAAMAIVGGNAALIVLALSLEPRLPYTLFSVVGAGLGGIGLIAIAAMVWSPFGYPAVFERISVYAITLGQALAAIRCLRIRAENP